MKKTIKNKSDPVAQFRRKVHHQKHARVGFAAARRTTDPLDFPIIVETLARQSIYRALLAVVTFPADVSKLPRLLRLNPISEDGEFIWTASVLRLFSEKLNSFIKIKNQFYHSFIEGDYVAAESELADIEEKFGVSLWLIQYKLQLLQLKYGLETQKNYVESLLSTEGISSFIAWLCYFFSLRSEENVSFSRISDEVASIIDEGEIGDYVRTHILPYDLTRIEKLQAPLNWEEPHAIIDRYETFVAMSQLKMTRERNSENSSFAVALKQLAEFDDPRIRQMEAILADRNNVDLSSEIITAADHYTQGNYSTIGAHYDDCLELTARANALSKISAEVDKTLSFKRQIIGAMQEVLTLSPNAQQHRLLLKKIAISCPRHPYSVQINCFVERTHEFILDKTYSELDYFGSMYLPLENPWSAALISGFRRRHGWLNELLTCYPNSVSLRLRHSLSLDSPEHSITDLKADLPTHRYKIYSGHVAFARGDFASAAFHYSSAASDENTYIASHAKRYLYEAYYASGNFRQCLILVVNHVLDNPTAVFAYKIEDLAKVCLEDSSLHSDITLAILLHLNVIHIHHKWEHELSDIFENVLYDYNVSKPSELEQCPDLIELRQKIYFLRYISIPRLLDDTTCFNSVDEIENERIAVCQYLLTIDPNNRKEYLAEIRILTRNINVAHLLKQVQASKIYVDEAGLRQSFENILADTYARYQKLLNSPALAYQAEKLSKILEEMLNAKGNTDLKDLRLPASEREALFLTLIVDFCSEFAFNPAYGLDTHISTSIRHGAFEGHIRTPFATEDLLCKKKDKEFVLSRAWESKLENFSPGEISLVRSQLARLTGKIEELISIYLKEKIRIHGDSVNGFFSFDPKPEMKESLRNSITESTDYGAFIDKFFAFAWQLVDDSMSRIRNDLLTVLSTQVDLTCESLLATLEKTLGHDKIIPLNDAIVRAQTNFHSAIGDVAEWFRKPQDLSRDPFDFEDAVHVALQQIENCYVKNPLHPEFFLRVHEKIDGALLDGICEILFILLQNAILHSGWGDARIDVEVSAVSDFDSLVISCRNQFSDLIDVTARQELAIEAMGRYERDTALKLARNEGGSGLSKIWRIAEFDLRLQHEIEIIVEPNSYFTTTVKLSGMKRINNVNLCH